MRKNKKKQGVSPFTLRERSIIEVRWCRDNKTITNIAVELNRNKSSISRELAGKPRRGVGKYRAEKRGQPPFSVCQHFLILVQYYIS